MASTPAAPQADARPPLDETLYSLEPEDEKLYAEQIGITDPEELKNHILAVQAEAYAVKPYQCIRRFSFARMKISKMPAYPQFLKLGRERKGALYLDLGCCVGNDIRKAILDGFPVSQAIGADLHPVFWDVGHKLFKSTPETFPVKFIPADVLDPASLAQTDLPTSVPTEPLDISSLTSLTPLRGRISALHTSAFFHLFSEEHQYQIAKLIAPLLSPEPGSIMFGAHGGLPQKGTRERKNTHGIFMFCHSPESWKELWEKQIFPEGQVRVDAFLKENVRTEFSQTQGDVVTKAYVLVWTITRL